MAVEERPGCRVIAALIIHAVSHLMKVGEMRRFYRLVPREFWLGVLTLAGVIVLDVLPGLILGVVVALVLLIYRASRPLISLLGADHATPGAFEDIRRHPDAVPIPGALIARPDAPLFYANAQLVREAIEHAVASSRTSVRAVVLVLDANDEIDITSTEQLEKLTDNLHAKNGIRTRRSASCLVSGMDAVVPYCPASGPSRIGARYVTRHTVVHLPAASVKIEAKGTASLRL